MDEMLPDSRLQQVKTGGILVRMPWGTCNCEPIFCANCGRPGGYVPVENMTFAFYLCDNCFERWGPPAGVMMVPDEVFWQQVAADHAGELARARERGDPCAALEFIPGRA